MQADNLEISPDAWDKLRCIQVLAMDVDGVLTNGSFCYDNEGRDLKSFHTADGLGIVLLQQCNIEIVWLTGRHSGSVEKRGRELGVRYVFQNVRNKRLKLEELCSQLNISKEAVGYIGDDWNDLPVFDSAALRIAVQNAVDEVKAAADIITRKPGGYGAVREVCELLLDAKGIRQTCLASYLESLRVNSEEEDLQRHAGQ